MTDSTEIDDLPADRVFFIEMIIPTFVPTKEKCK